MHKPKLPRRSRLIRKWDGTPVVGSDDTIEISVTDVAPVAQSPADQPKAPSDLAFEFEREEELSDTHDR